MTGLSASTLPWKHFAKLYRWKYYSARKKIENQRRELAKLYVAARMRRSHIEAQEKELAELQNTLDTWCDDEGLF